MNYFQLYETQRNQLKVSSKWIIWSKSVVEIIDTFKDSVSFKFITGGFIVTGISKDSFLRNFKPYNEPTTPHELLSTL